MRLPGSWCVRSNHAETLAGAATRHAGAPGQRPLPAPDSFRATEIPKRPQKCLQLPAASPQLPTDKPPRPRLDQPAVPEKFPHSDFTDLETPLTVCLMGSLLTFVHGRHSMSASPQSRSRSSASPSISKPPAPLAAVLSERQAAEYLAVSVHTLRRHRKRGTGPTFIEISKSRFAYRPAALDAWLDARTRDPAQPATGAVAA